MENTEKHENLTLKTRMAVLGHYGNQEPEMSTECFEKFLQKLIRMIEHRVC